jgi:Glycosyl transferase family 2
MTNLTVVIPATNAPETLGRCLAAIHGAADPPEEVIVVRTPVNAGPARARNLGAQSAAHEVIVFVDADVEIADDAFERIRRAFDADGELVAVFGSYDDDPERNGLVSDFRNLLHHHVHTSSAGPATTFWAGLGAIRRDAFAAIGGFDERLYPLSSIEDIELGMRLQRQGRLILLDPAIRGKHLKRWTLRTMVTTDLVRRGIPWVQLVLEHDARSTALNLGWRHRASSVATAGAALTIVMRRGRLAAALGVGVVFLNADFYSLLWRRRGWRQTAVGVPLHMLHQLVGVAAVPAGIYRYARERRHRIADQEEAKS